MYTFYFDFVTTFYFWCVRNYI